MPIDPNDVEWITSGPPPAQPPPSGTGIGPVSSEDVDWGYSKPSLFPRNVNPYDNPPDLKSRGFGMLRGAAGIGETVLSPLDYAAKRFGFGGEQGDWLGVDNRASSVDRLAREYGAKPESLDYKGGKLAAEIAGTAGTGQLLANLAKVIPGISPALVESIRSGGMSVGNATGLKAGLARGAGGAITGGATAGLIDPETAGTGALIGAAAPFGIKVAGSAGHYLGDKWAKAKAATEAAFSRQAPKFEVLRAAQDLGLVVPPASVNPTLFNRTRESIAGKYDVQQAASMRNQDVVERVARRALGMDDSAPLTKSILRQFNAEQYASGYEPLKRLGYIATSDDFLRELDDIARQYSGEGTIKGAGMQTKDIKDLVDTYKSKLVLTSDVITSIQTLRMKANEYFRKGDNSLGFASKAIANAYENMLDRVAQRTNDPNLVGAYRAARKNIAVSHTIGDALKDEGGAVDALKLAKAFDDGEPMTGDLRTVASFASKFKGAMQPPERMGSPRVYALRGIIGGLGAAGGAAAGNPALAAVAGAAPFFAPPMVTAQMFSKGAQANAIPRLAGPSSQSIGRVANLLDSPEFLTPALRAIYAGTPGLLAGE